MKKLNVIYKSYSSQFIQVIGRQLQDCFRATFCSFIGWFGEENSSSHHDWHIRSGHDVQNVP